MTDQWKVKHGMWRSKINTVWLNMMARCYNPKNPAYHNYGGRGIIVCQRWHNFNSFYEDLGDVPDGMELDRKDNDGPYSPDNVRWVTHRENSRNKRQNLMVTIGNETKPLIEWTDSSLCNVQYHTAYRRIRRGWEPLRALTEQTK